MRMWLVAIRENKGLSGSEVAANADVSYKSYNAYENGRRNPSVKVAKRIAEMLGFDWTKFFE